jgi:ABC-type lipoprotein release transport system permease subunit
VGVLLTDGNGPEPVADRIRVALGARNGDLEVLTWREAVPEMVGFVELDDAFGYIYIVVIFVVVLFAITNTFLMAVMERVREFGLLAALGLRGDRIGGLILRETLLLTALAMGAGFVIGYSCHLAADHWGINLAMWGLDEVEISGVDVADMVIRSTINPAKWFAASVLVALASLGSALYPAWRAMRLAPAEAMRFFE